MRGEARRGEERRVSAACFNSQQFVEQLPISRLLTDVKCEFLQDCH